MKHKNAFTLIELLVVISVIAVLIGLLIPALRSARHQAHRVVCQSHLRQLTLAWIAYADDHEGKLVAGSEDHTWVSQKDSSSVAQNLTLYDDEADVHQGLLWPYVNSAAIYKCPGAQKRRQMAASKLLGYGISRGVYNIGSGSPGVPKKTTLHQIKSSVRQMVFIDTGGIDTGSGGSTYLTYHQYRDLNDERWLYGPPILHSEGTNLSFADGHAEHWRWQDERTVELGMCYLKLFQGHTVLNWPSDHIDNEDLRQIKRAIWGNDGIIP
jgi:prepilin-type N-terminal cleavage/methylation domain-containing protein/prepilin-type processing-associated H-X9-DG protein